MLICTICLEMEWWVFQNLLLGKGFTSLIKTDVRSIVSHYSFNVLKKWMSTYANDSIIIINTI